MPPSEPLRVFISYARKDGAALAQRLHFPMPAISPSQALLYVGALHRNDGLLGCDHGRQHVFVFRDAKCVVLIDSVMGVEPHFHSIHVTWNFPEDPLVDRLIVSHSMSAGYGAGLRQALTPLQWRNLLL